MAKEAIKVLKKKLMVKSPKVVYLALILTAKGMEKCGYTFHVQVGTKEFMNTIIQLMSNKDMNPAVSILSGP